MMMRMMKVEDHNPQDRSTVQHSAYQEDGKGNHAREHA